ncbi:DNA polymerase subunit gamma-2, mitochondrial-like isoform X2 [Limulus polyphemus]|nr:DNA polymerase subunit gamma-2, mitochondrial-like isoform X2 [Limulus polyphemus]XP_022254143.1 DNA polymerase subunit gamma-2, mitochondrial-like isoform X2 [Limulus polyphemus]
MATDVNVFPVSTPVLKWQKEGTTKTGSIQMRSSLSEDTMGHYLSVLQTVNCQLPFGIVHSGLCFKSDLLVNLNSDADILMNLDVSSQHNDRNEGKIASSLISSVWNPLEKTHLMLMFFCSPKSFSSWLEYWQKHRLSWWRKFAGMPTSFSLTKSVSQDVSLQFTTSWEKITFETITTKSGHLPEDLKDQTMACKTLVPHVIECETNLDLAVLNYLFDAYQERETNSRTRQVLRIHHQLAPYKVTITASGATNKLRDLAIYITRQLRKSNVAVFPNPDLYCVSSLDSQFIHFDEMGIPYCIVLSERTLKTGIAGLRNRDTTITEQVHVKEMKNKLLYYLQMQ